MRPFLQIFFEALKPLFHLRQIADHQVEFDVLDVAQGIDGADMRNRIVLEGAQHMDQRVDIAQAGKERGLLQRLLPDGGDVDKFDRWRRWSFSGE